MSGLGGARYARLLLRCRPAARVAVPAVDGGGVDVVVDEGQAPGSGADFQTLTATMGAALAVAAAVLHLGLQPGWVAAGLEVNAVTHYFAGRRRPPERLAASIRRSTARSASPPQRSITWLATRDAFMTAPAPLGCTDLEGA